jgi:hypothetical protein
MREAGATLQLADELFTLRPTRYDLCDRRNGSGTLFASSRDTVLKLKEAGRLKRETLDALEKAIDSFIVLHKHEIHERNLALYDE